MKGKVKFYINSFCFLALFITVSVSCIIDSAKNKKVKRDFYFSSVTLAGNKKIYSDTPKKEYVDLAQIKKRGKLTALMGYSPNSYFVYRGTPMGFEHDLLQLLAKNLGVQLEIVIVDNQLQLIEKLRNGEGDLIADNLIVTKEKDALVDFTYPIMTTRQVLVQRKREMKKAGLKKAEESLIRSPLQLINETVHVRKGSAFYQRLKHLSEEIGGEICIVEEEGSLGTEELIRMVSAGKIPMTVADEETALMQQYLYANIDIQTSISFEQKVAWAVRETSPLLLEEINNWLQQIKKEKTFNRIYQKYYLERKGAKEISRCTRLSYCDRKISAYDKLIIAYAKKIGWDWRLLASLIYQESQFNPQAKSWAGASGLMQLMPATAQAFGAVNTEDPHESLRAGTNYLKWLEKYWEKKVPDKKERLKFILASYNVGQEHVADACRLTEKYGKNPCVWDNNVAQYLLLKAEEQYCKDPVVKYGYCRGSEPFNYVTNILSRYEHYKKLIQEEVHAQAIDTEDDGKS